MSLLHPHLFDLFDPHLQLEAEDFAIGDATPPGSRANTRLHGEIIGTIAALERLRGQLPPTVDPPSPPAER